MNIFLKIQTYIIIVLLISVLIITYYCYLNFNGYCFDKHQYLNFEQKQRSAVGDFLEKISANENKLSTNALSIANRNSSFRNLNLIKYQSVENFLELNPSCCSIDKTVGSEKETPTFMERITGRVSEYFSVEYFTTNQSVNYGAKHREVFAISNCGRYAQACGAGERSLICVYPIK